MTELPKTLRSSDIKKKLTLVESKVSCTDTIATDLAKTVFSQPDACKAIGRRLAMFEAGINDPSKPLGSMFFLGVSGSGKTEMAHAVSQYMFRDPKSPRLRIINMAEFTERHSAYRLTGSPPGYVGYNEPSLIPHDWLRNGRSIIVFDEVEKAHPAVHQTLLSILDKGNIEARNGKHGIQPLNFSQSLIIFTSNIGAVDMHKITENRSGLGFVNQEIDKEKAITAVAQAEIKKHFSPEFMNRIDDVVVFQELRDRKTYLKIVNKFIDRRNKDMADLLGIYATIFGVTDNFIDYVIDCTSNKGGREVSRVLDREFFGKAVDFLIGVDLSGKPLVADREGDQTCFYTTDDPPRIKQEILLPEEPKPTKKGGSSGNMVTIQKPTESGNLIVKVPTSTETKDPAGFIPKNPDKTN